MRRLLVITVAIAALVLPAAASATPVATSDAEYASLGRVFPDPLANCSGTPCDPNAQGNQPATQFIQYPELISGLRYLNSKPAWRRYLEVQPLDGKLGDGSGTDPKTAFPGNDGRPFHFSPKKAYHSTGLAQTGLSRKVSDLIMVRVTDETVPDKNKQRYVASLSIHGIERAGAEGGTRLIEDYVTAQTLGRSKAPVLPPGSAPKIPTFGEVLRKTVIYLIYPNPDGWRRGDVSEGGVFFQRYNGNGVDLNRDWPDVGFAFRPYSPLSERESQAFASVLKQIGSGDRRFGQVADLHGQPEADALSYTLLAHGRHDYGKNLRIRRTAEVIHKASEKSLSWSPIIQPNDAPRGGGAPCVPGELGDVCAQIYGQTWGTVYDTINYTTTGAMADWLDSSAGLNADAIDNEMSFSHLDKNIVFDPHTEQLHVVGNKALINAQMTQMLNRPRAHLDVGGTKGYVTNKRLKRKRKQLQKPPPTGTHPQADISNVIGSPDPTELGRIVFPIDVKRSRTIYNGGMRVEITNQNAGGVGPGAVTLSIECRRCDGSRHPGAADGDWIVVTEDFNQSPAYLQAGITAAVNEPQTTNRKGQKVEWRAVVGQGGLQARMDVDFTSGPATVSGETGSPKALPPELRAYDVSNTDFFRDLNKYIPGSDRDFRTVSPKRIAEGTQRIDFFDTLALADDALPRNLGASLRNRWYVKLRNWVSRGGNLVLTDGALRALPRLTGIPGSAVNRITVYVGQIAFAKADGDDTLDDRLNRGVDIPGARFNIGMRRQTFEPTPLGFSIQDDAGEDEAHSPQWQVDREAWEKAGGRTAATSVADEDVDGANDYDHTTYGELKVGKGRIRILGAALPQPTEQYDHDFGLSPYAATYTTHILMRNLLAPVGTPCHDVIRPRTFIDDDSIQASKSGVSARGTASDRGCKTGPEKGGVRRIRVSIAKREKGKRCRFAKPGGGLTGQRSCGKGRVGLRATGRKSWTFSYRHPLPDGHYTLWSRAIDQNGNGTPRTRRSTQQFRIR